METTEMEVSKANDMQCCVVIRQISILRTIATEQKDIKTVYRPKNQKGIYVYFLCFFQIVALSSLYIKTCYRID